MLLSENVFTAFCYICDLLLFSSSAMRSIFFSLLQKICREKFWPFLAHGQYMTTPKLPLIEASVHITSSGTSRRIFAKTN